LSGAREATLERQRIAREVVEFRGHRLVRSTHPTTIEITTEEYLSEEGDCVIGVGATKGCAGLSTAAKAAMRVPGSRVRAELVVEGLSFEVRASGDPRLQLSDPHEMVIRRSNYVSGRTLAVHADAASKDVPREIVRLLKNPATRARLEIEVS